MIAVSIIVTNHDYEAYLGECIDSALAQTHPAVEVIVVDDGSTDGSAAIIEDYGDAIVAVFKPNGGQASAFNVGFARSMGEVVIFLDADDLLDPSAAATAASLLDDPAMAKAHYPLREIDAHGECTGRLVPGLGAHLPHGDLMARVRSEGPATLRFPPTTGNAWARWYLERVLPMDEQVFRIGADTLLFELAPFVGPMARWVEPQGSYRAHGTNRWRLLPFRDQLEHELRFYDECVRVAEQLCTDDGGPPVDVASWRQHGWWPRLAGATDTLEQALPDDAPFALLDDGAWGMSGLRGRHVHPFPTAADGTWLGVPETAADVRAALDRTRTDGVAHLAVGWSSRWWLEHFSSLADELGEPVVRTADVDVYSL